MNRLFTFGCSFTKYNWAMWPEIVKFEYKPKEFYNYGRMAAGNQYIAHQVALANQVHRFTPQDTVMICWTHIFRKDWFAPHNVGEDDGWQCYGNIFHPNGLNSEIPESLFILEDYLARDLLTISNTIALLETLNIPNYQMQITSVFETMGDTVEKFENNIQEHPEIKPLLEYCQPKISVPYDSFIDTHEIWFSYFPQDREPYVADYHPMPEHHIDYLTKACGMEFSNATKIAAKKCQDYTFEFMRKRRATDPSNHDFNILFNQDDGNRIQDLNQTLENFSE